MHRIYTTFVKTLLQFTTTESRTMQKCLMYRTWLTSWRLPGPALLICPLQCKICALTFSLFWANMRFPQTALWLEINDFPLILSTWVYLEFLLVYITSICFVTPLNQTSLRSIFSEVSVSFVRNRPQIAYQVRLDSELIKHQNNVHHQQVISSSLLVAFARILGGHGTTSDRHCRCFIWWVFPLVGKHLYWKEHDISSMKMKGNIFTSKFCFSTILVV